VKWETHSAFDADLRRLSPEELERFRGMVRGRFAPAADRIATDPAVKWPGSLRVKDVEGAPGIWEMTWAWPDGRATFQWIKIDGELAIRWRRVGGHEILKDPARE